jgi:hypothetical protein
MKTTLALAALFATVLTPAIAVASQPAQPADQAAPPAQNAGKPGAANAPKNTVPTAAPCDTAKPSSSDAKTAHVPSPPMGKNTGDLPTPKKKSSSGTTCDPAPH